MLAGAAMIAVLTAVWKAHQSIWFVRALAQGKICCHCATDQPPVLNFPMAVVIEPMELSVWLVPSPTAPKSLMLSVSLNRCCTVRAMLSGHSAATGAVGTKAGRLLKLLLTLPNAAGSESAVGSLAYVPILML